MVSNRAEQGSVREHGVGRISLRPYSIKTYWPAAGSGCRSCVSRGGIQPLRYGADFAGGRWNFDRSNASATTFWTGKRKTIGRSNVGVGHYPWCRKTSPFKRGYKAPVTSLKKLMRDFLLLDVLLQYDWMGHRHNLAAKYDRDRRTSFEYFVSRSSRSGRSNRGKRPGASRVPTEWPSVAFEDWRDQD